MSSWISGYVPFLGVGVSLWTMEVEDPFMMREVCWLYIEEMTVCRTARLSDPEDDSF